MSIVGAVMVPHPPLAVPEVGRGSERQIKETLEAMREAARFVNDLKPETVLVISPHSPSFRDYIHISPGDGAAGSFARFGAGQVRLAVRYDRQLVEAIAAAAERAGFPAGTDGGGDSSLDHGVLVPLVFLRDEAGGELPYNMVRMGLSGLDYKAHYRLGTLVQAGVNALGRRVCVVASGDLSHYLKDDGPYGFRPEGPAYDRQVMDVMGRAAFGELMAMAGRRTDRAGECGHRSFLIMAGCLDGQAVRAQALSYQDVTGVGYGVCLFEPLGPDPARCFLEPAKAAVMDQHAGRSPHVRLARASYEHYVRTGSMLARPQGLPEELLNTRAGAFVTLHQHGDLRGCIGTIRPTKDCLADEIIANAVSAAARDPRFPPVTEDELPHITCSVDVLGAPEDIESTDELDVLRYGVIVSKGSRRGLLLPNLDGVDTVEEQVDIARRKAGIISLAGARLQRFEVVRHH